MDHSSRCKQSDRQNKADEPAEEAGERKGILY